jgi:hypothetical protein
MAPPPGFDPEHLGEQSRRVALIDASQISHKAYRIAALIVRREVDPSAVVSVHLERADIAIGPARIQGDKFAPDGFPRGKSRFSTAGKAARAA